jgi:hypothetical protein
MVGTGRTPEKLAQQFLPAPSENHAFRLERNSRDRVSADAFSRTLNVSSNRANDTTWMSWLEPRGREACLHQRLQIA